MRYRNYGKHNNSFGSYLTYEVYKEAKNPKNSEWVPSFELLDKRHRESSELVRGLEAENASKKKSLNN